MLKILTTFILLLALNILFFKVRRVSSKAYFIFLCMFASIIIGLNDFQIKDGILLGFFLYLPLLLDGTFSSLINLCFGIFSVSLVNTMVHMIFKQNS